MPMLRRLALRLSLLLVAATACARSTAAQSAPAPAAADRAAQDHATQPPSVSTIRTGTQLVIVDVGVQDKDGNAIHGLKPEYFRLSEDKNPQTVRHFEEHRSDEHLVPGPQLPPMPPGNFTNYTATPPNSTLNVLLLDTLNTPTKDQSYVRNQLQQFVKKADPGARIAIFGLATHLYLLQGFTSDPETLKDIINHKLIPRGSPLLDDPTGSNVDTVSLSDMATEAGATELAANLQQFEAETQSYQTQLRVQYTVDAFNALAHYLSSFPGRKNIVWFSGSFPLSIFPDASLNDPFAIAANFEDEFRETANLLTRAQVAVYPVDGRGLMTDPTFDAANSGRSMLNKPGGFAAASQKFNQSQAQEHMTMEEMASATGGHAFYNTNDLATATAKAIAAGSNYYTLTYSPANHNWNGAFRRIKVELTSDAAARGYKLTYREGYYADDPFAPKKATETASLSEAAAAATSSSATYTRLAMSRGAPTPQDILMKVRVLPDSDKTEDKVADGNTLNPTKPIKPPFRRYDIDIAAVAQDLRFNATADHRYSDALEFKIFVYDTDGTLLNAAGSTANLNLLPETYKTLLQQGIKYHAEVSAPAKGESFLRIAIHDLNSNRFGVVEVPTSRVARLPPPAYATQPAPAAAPVPTKP